MARRAHVYPQVEPGAAALTATTVAVLPRGASVSATLGLARKRDVTVFATAAHDVVLREDLARAVDLGLGDRPATDLARRAPIVDARASEVTVRRHLAAGAPLVLVRRGGILGAATAPTVLPPAPSMANRVRRGLPAETIALLDRIGRLAAEHAARAYLVGGVPRDLLLGRSASPVDLDVVVEGDAPALASALAKEIGGRAVGHDRFLTASVEAPTGHRIDVITARSERYEMRGALPRVMPAGMRQDLRRRDFTVNALAIELGTTGFPLLDPFGGRGDLARRRLRVLTPLSFVEDPTRIFRGARYGARLGLAFDGWTARCVTLAVRLAPYPALSGQRLVAELARIVEDAKPDAALVRLGRLGAYRLFDDRHRFTRRTAERLARLPDTLAWIRMHGLAALPVELCVLATLADQPRAVTAAAMRRLGFSGEPLNRLETAFAVERTIGTALAEARGPSGRAEKLRRSSDVALAWLRLAGDPATRGALDWYVTHARDARASLRGDELIALGVAPGPDVKRALEAVRDARIDGAIDDRAAETEYVRHWVRTREEG